MSWNSESHLISLDPRFELQAIGQLDFHSIRVNGHVVMVSGWSFSGHYGIGANYSRICSVTMQDVLLLYSEAQPKNQ